MKTLCSKAFQKRLWATACESGISLTFASFDKITEVEHFVDQEE